MENVVAGLVLELAPLAEAVRLAEGASDEPFVVVEHIPRSEAEIGKNIPETFDLVVFSSYEPRQVGSAFFWRHTLGEPDWRHCTRAQAKLIAGEDLDDASWLSRFRAEVEKRVPKDDGGGTGAELASVGQRRREEAHDMLPPLPWDPETGDVVLERVPDFEGGLDLAGNLKHKVRTNVPWSVVEHSPTGLRWGYGGSGPADLALNILNLFEPPGSDGQGSVKCFDGEASRTAYELHKDFKARFLAGMPWEGGRILGTEIRAWISERVVRAGGIVVGYVTEGARAV